MDSTHDSRPNSDLTNLDRRAFLRGATAAALGAGLLSDDAWGTSGADPTATPKVDAIPKRILGRTGLKVTPVSFGGIQIQNERLLDLAIDRGMRLVHTSPGYGGGKSIRIFGKVMKRRRQEVILALKASPVGGIDEHLKTLNTDSVDLLIPPLHSVDAMDDPDLPGAYEKLKKEGKIRFSGYACHSNVPDVMNRSVDLGFFDVMLIAYHLGNYKVLDPILTRAKEQQDMGFLAMKVAHKIAPEDIPAAFDSLLRNPRVDSLLVGMATYGEVRQNAAVSGQRTGFLQQLQMSQYAALATTGCAMCGACDCCPRGVAVSDILRCGMYHQRGETALGRSEYGSLPTRQTLTACDGCGLCERACPRSRPVLGELREVHAALA